MTGFSVQKNDDANEQIPREGVNAVNCLLSKRG